MHPNPNHDEVLVWVDIKHLLFDSHSVIAWILGSVITFIVQVIPIEMITVVAVVIFGRQAYPFLAHDTFSVPYAMVEIKAAYLS